MKEIWSLCLSGRKRDYANWNSVPLLNQISQQEEEEEDKKENEGAVWMDGEI